MKANIEKVSVETIKDAEALAEAIVDSEYGCKHDVAFLNYYALNILRHDCLSTIEQFKQKIVNDLSDKTKAFFREAFAEEKEEPKEEQYEALRVYKPGQLFRNKNTGEIYILHTFKGNSKVNRSPWSYWTLVCGDDCHEILFNRSSERIRVQDFNEWSSKQNADFEPIEITIKQNEVK